MPKLFAKQTITLISPHPVDECHRRLKESVETSFFPYFSDKKVAGRATNISINIRRLARYRNSFQRILNASYYQTPEGAIINGRFGIHPFVWAFLAVWYGFIALFFGVIGFVAITDYLKNEHHIEVGALLLVIFFSLFAVFPVLLSALGRHLAKGEADFIKNFLINLLDAREMDLATRSQLS